MTFGIVVWDTVNRHIDSLTVGSTAIHVGMSIPATSEEEKRRKVIQKYRNICLNYVLRFPASINLKRLPESRHRHELQKPVLRPIRFQILKVMV